MLVFTPAYRHFMLTLCEKYTVCTRDMLPCDFSLIYELFISQTRHAIQSRTLWEVFEERLSYIRFVDSISQLIFAIKHCDTVT